MIIIPEFAFESMTNVTDTPTVHNLIARLWNYQSFTKFNKTGRGNWLHCCFKSTTQSQDNGTAVRGMAALNIFTCVWIDSFRYYLYQKAAVQLPHQPSKASEINSSHCYSIASKFETVVSGSLLYDFLMLTTISWVTYDLTTQKRCWKFQNADSHWCQAPWARHTQNWANIVEIKICCWGHKTAEKSITEMGNMFFFFSPSFSVNNTHTHTHIWGCSPVETGQW